MKQHNLTIEGTQEELDRLQAEMGYTDEDVEESETFMDERIALVLNLDGDLHRIKRLVDVKYAHRTTQPGLVRNDECDWTVGFKTEKGVKLQVVVREWSAKGAVRAASDRQRRLRNKIREILFVKEWV